MTKKTAEKLKFDIVVIGGGVAGVCAAIQAARLGGNVALLERESVLGGNSSSLFRLHLIGCGRYHPHSRHTGIIEELEAEAAKKSSFINVGHGDYLNDHWSQILQYKCQQAGVNLFLKTVVTDVETKNEKIKSVNAYDMFAKSFISINVNSSVIEASGDGIAALSAGADFHIGAEARDEFNESFAPKKANPNQKMASALLFMMRDTGHPVKYTPPQGTPVYKTEKDIPSEGIESWDPTEPVCIMWQTMFGGHLDTMFDDRIIYDKLLKIIHGTVDFIKNRGDHGAENYELCWISPYIGKREGRRFLGDHILCQNDIFEPVKFNDRVAYGGRMVDVHEIQPDKEHYKITFYDKPPLYSIPFRCLYSRNIENLYLAGRCISGTRIAFGSYRVMKTLAGPAQAVGAAAYIGAREGLKPRQIYEQKIAELQQLLLREDAGILDLANNDSEDVARNGKVIASSETEDGKAENILNGINRRFYEVPSNMWISEKGLPQWIEVELAKPAVVGLIQLSWDTNLNEARGYRYTPYLETFPQTAADYRVLVLADDKWVEVANIQDNYQRLMRHSFEPILISRIKVEINRAQADGQQARLYELRAYKKIQ